MRTLLEYAFFSLLSDKVVRTFWLGWGWGVGVSVEFLGHEILMEKVLGIFFWPIKPIIDLM
jgi:hypothetical protein